VKHVTLEPGEGLKVTIASLVFEQWSSATSINNAAITKCHGWCLHEQVFSVWNKIFEYDTSAYELSNDKATYGSIAPLPLVTCSCARALLYRIAKFFLVILCLQKHGVPVWQRAFPTCILLEFDT